MKQPILSLQSAFGLALLVPFVVWVGNDSPTPHPNHFSNAEVRWNEATGNFEIALCVWPPDLEKALSHQSNATVDLDKTEKLDELIAEYIQKKFFIRKIENPDPDTVTDIDAERVENDIVQRQTIKKLLSHEHGAELEANSKDLDKTTKQAAPTAKGPKTESSNAKLKDNQVAEDKTPATPSAESDVPAEAAKDQPANDDDKSTPTTKPIPKFRWVGYEANLKEAWLYFEIAGHKEVATWEIENGVFFEFNVDQVNQIRLTNGNQVRAYSLKPNQPVWQFTTTKKKWPNSLPAAPQPNEK